jgi:hypothetical protein
MKNPTVLLLLATCCSSFAFQTPSSSSRGIRTSSSSSTARHAVVPPEVVQSLLTDSHAWSSHLVQGLNDASTADLSTFTLADAAAAVAETSDAVEKDGGWWASYLNIFKSTLLLVHSTIDGPLRSVGFTQTWGVSIAIFTACK